MPFVLTYGVLPLVGVPPHLVDDIHCLAYLCGGLVYVLAAAVNQARSLLPVLHNSIRDERYMIGKKLSNYDHEKKKLA